MRFVGQCYRAHNPKWSTKPLSGDGAAIRGARFNPKGVVALYLALSIEGAVAEAAQGFGRKLEPLTICMYEVDCDDVTDLRTEAKCARAGVAMADLACAWMMDIAQGREPRSWIVVRRLIKEGVAGILVPSFARGSKTDAANLVLWRWGPHRPHKIDVYDPSGRLPKDQLSWE